MNKEAIKLDKDGEDMPELFGIEDDKKMFDFIRESITDSLTQTKKKVGLNKQESVTAVTKKIGKVDVNEAFYWGFVYGAMHERIDAKLRNSMTKVEKIMDKLKELSEEE